MSGVRDRNLLYIPTTFKLWSCIGFNFNIFNMSCHHYCLCIDAMLECCFPFLVCFCFSLVGSRVDVSNESDVKINNTDDQYLSIDVRLKKNPEDLFGLSKKKARITSFICFPSFQLLVTTYCIRFKCLLSIVRVILSIACFPLVA
jgi:hypothetical protein